MTASRTSGRGPVIFVGAGEPSGDLHGSALVPALRARFPHARLLGLGGPRMAAEGVELLAGLDQLAVMGFAEVLAHLPFFLKLRRRVFQTLEREAVDLVIPIDYPGFNLRLARHAKSLEIPVLYYIAPQVWAWHSSRARALAADADRVAVILPFEEDFLRGAGADARFVSHPLLDLPGPAESRSEWCAGLGLAADRPVLALFPGSRPQEVRRHLELFLAAAKQVARRVPAVQTVIGAAPDLDRSLFDGAGVPLAPDPRTLLHFADAALVKSGTTTLEAALAGTPFVVVYRMSPWSYQLARRVVRVPHIALANLVADERLAPEFVQNEAQPETLAAALAPLLVHGTPERDAMRLGFSRIRSRLGGGGAAEQVADMAAELLEARGYSRA